MSDPNQQQQEAAIRSVSQVSQDDDDGVISDADFNVVLDAIGQPQAPANSGAVETPTPSPVVAPVAATPPSPNPNEPPAPDPTAQQQPPAQQPDGAPKAWTPEERAAARERALTELAASLTISDEDEKSLVVGDFKKVLPRLAAHNQLEILDRVMQMVPQLVERIIYPKVSQRLSEEASSREFQTKFESGYPELVKHPEGGKTMMNAIKAFQLMKPNVTDPNEVLAGAAELAMNTLQIRRGAQAPTQQAQPAAQPVVASRGGFRPTGSTAGAPSASTVKKEGSPDWLQELIEDKSF